MITKVNDELLMVRLEGMLDSPTIDRIARELNIIEQQGTCPKRIVFVDENLVIAIKSQDVVLYRKQRLAPRIVTKTVFCVFSDLQFGIARMFQAILENDTHLIEIFRDRAAAAQWLGVDMRLLEEPPA
jgi:hypothetical protein